MESERLLGSSPGMSPAPSLEAAMARLDLLKRSGVEEATQSSSGGDSSGGPGPASQSTSTTKLKGAVTIPEHRVKRFHKLLSEAVVDLDALRELSWSGIPYELRPVCWRLLLGYLPPAKSRQSQTLARRRREYTEMVPEYYDIENSERTEDELSALRQVIVDVPRTSPTVPFFHQAVIQKSLERLLYIWGIRHPASGYVQGMNDLVTPFIAVFLSEHLQGPMEAWAVDTITQDLLLEVEADCYWCMCKLVEGIQDHYTYAQPGIQRAVFKIKELCKVVHPKVAHHLEEENVDFMQFAFRWVNCLLLREMPFELAIRLWDTYMAEGSNFEDFLVYICVSFISTWKAEIPRMEFQDLIMFLQKLPTQSWDENQLEMVLSQAYTYRVGFEGAQSHLRQ
ncbi:MAG: hypothetical protein WDW38_000741 [Sanguina aurantia]